MLEYNKLQITNTILLKFLTGTDYDGGKNAE
jgi:hypothetical protein